MPKINTVCRQVVKFGTGLRAMMPCGWKRNRGPGEK